MSSKAPIVRQFTTAELAASRLCDLSLDAEPGTHLGGEEALELRLGVSRSTLRQAARIAEREGLIHVRRGINGGYFSARPDVQHIEQVMSGYLRLLTIERDEMAQMVATLWTEVMRKAAKMNNQASRAMADTMSSRLSKLGNPPSFDEIRTFEQFFRSAAFALTESRYPELIFSIHTAFAKRSWGKRPINPLSDEEFRRVAGSWRRMTMMEIEAILMADEELAVLAGQQCRKLWLRLVEASDIEFEDPAG